MSPILSLFYGLIQEGYSIEINRPMFEDGLEIQLHKLSGGKNTYATIILTSKMIKELPDGILPIMFNELKEKLERG